MIRGKNNTVNSSTSALICGNNEFIHTAPRAIINPPISDNFLMSDLIKFKIIIAQGTRIKDIFRCKNKSSCQSNIRGNLTVKPAKPMTKISPNIWDERPQFMNGEMIFS